MEQSKDDLNELYELDFNISNSSTPFNTLHTQKEKLHQLLVNQMSMTPPTINTSTNWKLNDKFDNFATSVKKGY